MIWFKEFTPAMLNDRPKNHIGAVLGIEFTEVGDDYICATMPVDERTHQPAGILHGGASVVLAETLGSIASYMCIDPNKHIAVGLEVNANHIRPVSSGFVKGICKPLHIGGKTQILESRGACGCNSAPRQEDCYGGQADCLF